nr:MAG TPA: DNA directed RNA polymerase subunit [Caudoviricetes sp.]DAX00247.1 MAG TPA: DNA directed RNA polymerase subunit [Bacteriophage sp.]
MSKKIIFTDRSDSLLTSYLKDISKYKILDSDEVTRLICEAQKGDDVAREQVIKSNLRFVVTIAKQFQNRGIPLMDLISSGNEGLMKAIDKFDPERGVTFLSYAVWWIRQSIYNSIYWQAREIRLPMSQQLLVISILDATNKFLQSHDRNPSSEEISEMTDIPREQIDYLAQFSNKLVSVDDFIGGDEENSQVCDVIPDGEDPLDEQVNKIYVAKEIENLLSKLTIREHDLICMLFGIGMAPVNPKIIADMYGVGGERIRQMKEGALAKLRRRFSNQLKNLL